MSTISTKMQTGTAACAIALAATLTPAAIANASPASPPIASLGGSAGVGSAVVAPDCVPTGSGKCEEAGVSAAGVSASGGATIRSFFQNRLVWFGTPNPNPPERTTIFEFSPLGLIPGFLRPLYGWFTQNLNFEACILGASVKVGPYGSVTGAVGNGC
jgi:hypothetical protein